MKQILIPELVPLSNKGEEAIVRGVADVLFPGGDCELHLFDDVPAYSFRDGIHVYPVNWFISPWLNREFGLGVSWEKTRDSASSLWRNLLHRIQPGWVQRSCGALRRAEAALRHLHNGAVPTDDRERALARLLTVDYIVAGHDGALDERVCQFIDVFRSLGWHFGVFGVELPNHFKSPQIAHVLGHTLRHAEFFHCRTEASAAVVAKHFPEIRADVQPDPAFGMKPAALALVDDLVHRHGLIDLFARPVVMVTSCEPAPIARHCFERVSGPQAKLDAHRSLLARLLTHILDNYNVNVLFLPHAIGPGHALDDRIVAADVIARAKAPAKRVRLLDADLSARELKGLIARAEYVVAERVHSIIGATGVATPFLCLGSRTDRRLEGIVNQMVGEGDAIFHLNDPDEAVLLAKFDNGWQERAAMSDRLHVKGEELRARLESVAVGIRQQIAAAKR